MIAVFSIVAVCIRYLGRDFTSADLENCLGSWYLEITGAGSGIASLQAYTGDYSMPYIFMMWLWGKLPMPFEYSIKILNSVFDFTQAIVIGMIVRHFKPKDSFGFIKGYAVALLVPNVFLNSAYWGQCDGMYCTFLFAALLCYLKEKYPVMMLMLGGAFSFKLQAVFMIPFVLIVYWLNKKFSIFQFLIIPLTMMI
jgi:Gpi18-like mannosyltransferase